MRFARSSTRWYVSSEVAIPRITSTSDMTGTGLKKCMPIFDDRFDDDVGIRDRLIVRRGPDSAQRRLLVVGRHLALVDAALKVRGDRVDRTIENRALDIDQRNVKARC